MMSQFCRLDSLHNSSANKTQIILDLKDSGHLDTKSKTLEDQNYCI